jgi:hypothetical protein
MEAGLPKRWKTRNIRRGLVLKAEATHLQITYTSMKRLCILITLFLIIYLFKVLIWLLGFLEWK